MGDRRNIVIEADNKCGSAVTIYTHWAGSEMPYLLQDALNAGKSRWDDPDYLSRVIFQKIINGNEDVSGYGLGSTVINDDRTFKWDWCEADRERDIIVNVADRMIYTANGALQFTFEEYADLDDEKFTF